jgi:large subunit ribosomal protein L9
MEVILREDVDKLGNRGQTVEVAAGYARNFLLPKRMAVRATQANRKIVEQERQAHVRREATERGAAEELAKLLNGVSVTIAQKAGEMDQLFGSVTVKDIAEALEKENFTIERRKIHLDEPIKQLGEHPVVVKLFRDVSAEIKVNVVREEE